jgi:hypothetical protein
MVLGLLVVGCSHTAPYIRDDVPSVLPTDVPDLDGPGAATIVGDPFVQRILLVGDAGDNDTPPPVFALLEEWASVAPHRTVIAFLGDNAYPAGIPAEAGEERTAGLRRLDVQLEVARRTGATAVVIPGNHDWGPGGPEGRRRVEAQAARVAEVLGDRGRFVPSPGHPGPVVLDREGIRLVAIDTDWWLLGRGKEGPVPFLAEVPESEVLDDLAEAMRGAGSRPAVLLAHHPLATHGPHGGFHDWTDHVFPLRRLHRWAWIPLPVVGSLYPLVRSNLAVSSQDLRHRDYQRMVGAIESALADAPPVVVASGHDHGLQVLDAPSGVGVYVVSGAGSPQKLQAIGNGEDTRFAVHRTGFVALDLLDEERLLLRVVAVGEPEVIHAEIIPLTQG